MVREAIAIAKPILQIIAALSGAGKDQPAEGSARDIAEALEKLDGKVDGVADCLKKLEAYKGTEEGKAEEAAIPQKVREELLGQLKEIFEKQLQEQMKRQQARPVYVSSAVFLFDRPLEEQEQDDLAEILGNEDKKYTDGGIEWEKDEDNECQRIVDNVMNCCDEPRRDVDFFVRPDCAVIYFGYGVRFTDEELRDFAVAVNDLLRDSRLVRFIVD